MSIRRSGFSLTVLVRHISITLPALDNRGMTQLNGSLISGAVILGVIVLPAVIFFGSEKAQAFLGITFFMIVGSLLGATVAAGICLVFRSAGKCSAGKYDYAALIGRGMFAGLAVSIATMLVPLFVKMGDAIWAWPAIVGMPVAALTVVVLHLGSNESR